MTRFARASGSKGSNDKRPEDSTSWHELKSAMLAKNRKNDPVDLGNDAETEEATIPSTDEILSVWADLVSESDVGTKRKLKKKKDHINSTEGNKSNVTPNKAVDGGNLKKMKRKLEADHNNPLNAQVGSEEVQPKKKMKKDKILQKKSIVVSSVKETNEFNTNGNARMEDETQHKKKAKKTKKLQKEMDNNNEVANEGIALEKKKKKKNVLQETIEETPTKKSYDEISPPKAFKKKGKEINTPIIENTKLIVAEEKPKVKRRRKEELRPCELFINGKPVQVAPFDGFVVQAEDAQRLRELRKNMKAKGIPEADREQAIKLERRRAEKSLARLKKRVCFHCRGSGHNLSECPQVQDDQRSTGICYKCGSTEHTHFQCRVGKADDFRYAECFICKEQGHISKQCPDNPRGLYPRGGACITCGDVTHLKKDCPKYLAEKEDEALTVGTRNNRALEAIDEDLQPSITKPILNKKPKQHIKF